MVGVLQRNLFLAVDAFLCHAALALLQLAGLTGLGRVRDVLGLGHGLGGDAGDLDGGRLGQHGVLCRLHNVVLADLYASLTQDVGNAGVAGVDGLGLTVRGHRNIVLCLDGNGVAVLVLYHGRDVVLACVKRGLAQRGLCIALVQNNGVGIGAIGYGVGIHANGDNRKGHAGGQNQRCQRNCAALQVYAGYRMMECSYSMKKTHKTPFVSPCARLSAHTVSASRAASADGNYNSNAI